MDIQPLPLPIAVKLCYLYCQDKKPLHLGYKNMLTHSQKQGLVMIAIVVGLMTLPIIY